MFKHANVPPAVWLVMDPQLLREPSNETGQQILESSKGKIDVIGDIHGHLTLLLTLFEKMGWTWDGEILTHPEPERKIVLLGDLINGGENSLECLKIGRSILQHRTGISLMGNHEWQLLAWIKSVMPHPPHNGCMDAFIEEWKTLSSQEKDAYTAWLKILPDNVWVEHPTLDTVEFIHGAPKEAVQGMTPWLANHPHAAQHARIFGMPRTNEFFQVCNADWRPLHAGNRWTITGHQPLNDVVIEGKTVHADIGNRNGLAGLRLDKGLTPPTIFKVLA